MFAALAPLVKERSVHVLISAGADNRLAIYVEPVVKDKENCAFGSPFRCEASPEELDAQFAAVIAKWLNTRSSALKSLSEALAEAEATTKKAAEDSKQKIADAKAKQAAAKTDNCKRAQQAKAMYDTGKAVRMPNEKGEMVFQNAEQRATEVKRTDEAIFNNC